MPARQPTPTATYRIRNRKRSNHALVNRGSLTLSVDPATLPAWRYQGPARRGAPFEYSDLASECPPTLRGVAPLTLRATEGFARSGFGLLGVDPAVPDDTTLRRRAATVRIPAPRKARGPLHLVLDSTGLKVYGEGEWKVRQHGDSGRRPWLKLHPAADPLSHEIQAAMVTEPGVTDAGGAYDRRSVYEALGGRGASAVIPPRRAGEIQRHGNRSGPRPGRDEHLRRSRRIGRSAWKGESGYHERWLAETAMSRMRTIFGDVVTRRTPARQATEAGVRCRSLRIMTHQGMPQSERIVA